MGKITKVKLINIMEIVCIFGSLAFVWMLSLFDNDYEMILAPILSTFLVIGFILMIIGFNQKKKI